MRVMPKKQCGDSPLKNRCHMARYAKRSQVDQRIQMLAIDPRPNSVKKLKGTDAALYRIRQGNHRIIYAVKDDVLVVLIIAVSDRKEAYR